MDQEKIGKFIANLRIKKNMTQQELADKLGITDRAISKWENGRGMPDISLMKPLCRELDISINELLSGERIKKEEEEKKFEENVLNTIDYSKKKIKHTKLIFKIILAVIIFLIIAFSILLGIDIYRMRNNEPVFFSTWGIMYTPTINLDDLEIEKTIKIYLIDNDEKINHYANEKSFVAMKVYLTTRDKDKYYVYAWVLQEKYYSENEKVIKDTGSSLPYKFELIKENGKFLVKDYSIPRDGSYYAKDMKKIFPINVLWNMNKVQTDGTIERLTKEIEEDRDLYFKN